MATYPGTILVTAFTNRDNLIYLQKKYQNVWSIIEI